MKVLIAGATGAAGLPILRALLADPAVDGVTVLARRALPAWIALSPDAPTSHSKLTTLQDVDFLHYAPHVQESITTHDACIWALGKTTRGMTEAAYTEITVEYLHAFLGVLEARKANSAERPFRVVYLSGNGADPSEKSSIMFARVKGRAENVLLSKALASNGAIKAAILRPAYFFPSSADALHQRSAMERCAHVLLGKPLSVLMPSGVISTEDMARFAVEAAKGRWSAKGPVFESSDMKRLAREA
ncbi:hypothetical protein BV25DRAFT_1869062 [Artomyces pyxidatus]|uniref:Uncharacterized protein n=1 Tax=Artomyces pyxidatus TaxID=48021 RepID=A0ACB8T9I7_9AGAM|nr:hypothetical protein BV25DRAFT_1869062 [Artomyces pyxidatus]